MMVEIFEVNLALAGLSAGLFATIAAGGACSFVRRAARRQITRPAHRQKTTVEAVNTTAPRRVTRTPRQESPMC